MKKSIRRIICVAGGILAFIVILIIVGSLLFFFKKSIIKGYIEKYLAKNTGVQIQIGKIDYSLSPLRVQADSVKVFLKTDRAEFDVFLERFTSSGVLKRLIRNEKPFLDRVEITGAIFNVNQKEKAERVDIRQIIKFLHLVKIINIENSSFRFVSPSQELRVQNLKFSLSKSNMNEEFNYVCESDKVTGKSIDQNISFESPFHSSGKFYLADLPAVSGEFQLGHLNIRSPQEKLSLQDLEFNLRSDFRANETELTLSDFELSIPALLDVSASIQVSLKKDLSFLVAPKLHLKNLNKFFGLLRPYLPAQEKKLTVYGSLYLEGKYHHLRGSAGEKKDLECLVKLEPTRVNYSSLEFTSKNLVSSEIRIEGPLDDINLSGHIRLEEGSLHTKNLSARGIILQLPISGNRTRFKTPAFKGSIESLAFALEDKRIDQKQIRFSGEGSYDLDRGKINYGFVELSAPPLLLRAEVDLKPQGKKYIHLKGSKLGISNLLSQVSPFLPEEIKFWEPEGYLNLEMEAINNPRNKGEFDIFGNFELSDGKFHNPSLTILAESLHPQLTLKTTYTPAIESMPLALELDLLQGEALWNAFYLNLGKIPFQARLTGKYHRSLQKLEDLSIDASLYTLGRINARGELKFRDPTFADFLVSFSDLNLHSARSFFSQEQAGDQPLFELEGEAHGQVRINQKGSQLSLRGECRVENGIINRKDQSLLISGIEAQFPFFYETGDSHSDSENELFEKGYFLADEFRSPYFSMNPLQVNFYATRNLFLIEPLSFEVFGGKARIGKSVLALTPKPLSFKGFSSFSLDDLDISQIPIKSKQFELKGRIRADFQKVEINPQELSTQGQGEIDIFGGKARIKNIGIARLFAKSRTISCDVDFNDLDLEKMTDSIPFGKVTGVVSGEIKDLAFSYGQPESFALSMESEKRDGIPQRFSVKAVNDLSILSSGEGTSLSPARGLTRFISSFRYKKIGISCSLKNDKFTLRGTMRKDGVEYLVQKSWLFGISVINKKPQNNISFKDMLERLKRIGQSKETK